MIQATTTPGEMVAKVAAALLDHQPTWTQEHWDEERQLSVREFLESSHVGDIMEQIALEAARAAIAAMRKPTPAMVDAYDSMDFPMSQIGWGFAIDAALQDDAA